MSESKDLAQELLDMANRHWCGECGGFLSSELDFVKTAEKLIDHLAAMEAKDREIEGSRERLSRIEKLVSGNIQSGGVPWSDFSRQVQRIAAEDSGRKE